MVVAVISAAESARITGEFFAYTKAIKKSGHYVGDNALQPTPTATTVRVRPGKSATPTDRSRRRRN
jgi:hypothetical protein